jgi:hypothetical protein
MSLKLHRLLAIRPEMGAFELESALRSCSEGAIDNLESRI